nr:MAG TPA: hypothetical protein [Caudoviricetes sp.]
MKIWFRALKTILNDSNLAFRLRLHTRLLIRDDRFAFHLFGCSAYEV